MTTRRWIAPMVALLVGACAYYNGLYNANHLAEEARRAEREGRTGEARSFWSRAAVKAESVTARYPRSKYRDDALLLHGMALERLGICTQAVPSLRLASDSSPDLDIRMQSSLLLARCRLQMQEPDSVMEAVAPVLAEGRPVDRAAALLLRGTAYLRLGNDRAALEDLATSTAPQAVFPRAVALARLGRTAEAAAVLGAAAARPIDETAWLSTLDSVGRRAPEEAGGLVDRLAGRRDLSDGTRARLWVSDGERWLAAADRERAERRFRRAAEVAPDSAEGRSARAYLVMGAVRRARRATDVPVLFDSLSAATRQGGPAIRIAGPYVTVLERGTAALAADSADLALFLAAEDVRDSLRAPELAAALFAELSRRYPQSVLAPKALLAQATLEPRRADSLVARVTTDYAESVYALALLGQGLAAYEALEDSLRQAARHPLERGPNRRPGEARPGRPADEGRRVRNERN
ncbi:MAG: hypothetical protein OER21_10020 [Gemmatimonadota bacterium]|nr:hypothetical protein [Gemmatimonadota bacterium]